MQCQKSCNTKVVVNNLTSCGILNRISEGILHGRATAAPVGSACRQAELPRGVTSTSSIRPEPFGHELWVE